MSDPRPIASPGLRALAPYSEDLGSPGLRALAPYSEDLGSPGLRALAPYSEDLGSPGLRALAPYEKCVGFGVGGARGSMAVETVLLAPVMLLFLLFLVGAGRIVQAQGQVNGAARDAARAASVQRELGVATQAAQKAVTLAGCTGTPEVSLSGTDWREGGSVQVTVTCTLDLSFLGWDPGKQMTGTSVVPLEQFRRVQ